MRTSVKLGLTALVAAFVLSSAVGTASARNLSVSQESIRATWTSLEFEGNIGIPERCQLTLEGSFHSRTVAKSLGALIGVITRGALICTNGRDTVSRLPWHVTYEGFTGELPAIRTIRILLRELL